MPMIGFSTGAIAKGDFRTALSQLAERQVSAVELSALREHELPALVDALSGLDLSPFAYVSLHVPSSFCELSENRVVDLLGTVDRSIPLIVHPDSIISADLWRPFGRQLCLENMDQRKRTGRTLEELEEWFGLLPEASFCFDVGHARQVDLTMTLAVRLLLRYSDRIRQVHMSEVTPSGAHVPMSFSARGAFTNIASLIPVRAPVILESVVTGDEIDSELEVARNVFATAGESLDRERSESTAALSH